MVSHSFDQKFAPLLTNATQNEVPHPADTKKQATTGHRNMLSPRSDIHPHHRPGSQQRHALNKNQYMGNCSSKPHSTSHFARI